MAEGHASGAPDEFASISPGRIVGNIAQQVPRTGFRVVGTTRDVPPESHGFGGHSFGSDEAIARERQEGRVGPIHRANRDG